VLQGKGKEEKDNEKLGEGDGRNFPDRVMASGDEREGCQSILGSRLT